MAISHLFIRVASMLSLSILAWAFSLGATVHAASASECRDNGNVSVHCGEAPSAWFGEDGRLWVVFAHQ